MLIIAINNNNCSIYDVGFKFLYKEKKYVSHFR